MGFPGNGSQRYSTSRDWNGTGRGGGWGTRRGASGTGMIITIDQLYTCNRNTNEGCFLYSRARARGGGGCSSGIGTKQNCFYSSGIETGQECFRRNGMGHSRVTVNKTQAIFKYVFFDVFLFFSGCGYQYGALRVKFRKLFLQNCLLK